MKKDRLKGALFIVGIAAFAAMAGYLLMQGNGKQEVVQSVAEVPGGPAQGGLIETRPILPPSYFTGRAAKTYQYAAQIPQAVDALYCYCQCKENPMFKHKTLLTCFTDDHGANCDVCMNEVEMAWDMTQRGKTPKEIRAAVDDFYAKRRSAF